MKRYRVEVTRTEGHIVDATSADDATSRAIEWAKQGARPVYACEPTAVAERIADTEGEAA